MRIDVRELIRNAQPRQETDGSGEVIVNYQTASAQDIRSVVFIFVDTDGVIEEGKNQ